MSGPIVWPRRASAPWRYLVAVAAFAVALLFRYALRDTLGATVPFLQFYPAVIVGAWYGGLGPGILLTAISALLAMFLFLPPAGLAVTGPADLLSLAVFTATGLAISWLNHLLHQTRQQAHDVAATATARAERLDAILNMTADGIIVIDATGKIEAFNPGAQKLFGYPESEVVGRNVRMLMPSPHHEDHDKYLGRYMSSVRLEGELGASEARWRAVVDSAVDGIIVIDAHGRVEAFNHAAERLFGYAADEVLGRNVNMLMPSPYREEHDSYLSRYLATGRAKIIGVGREVQGRRKDGSTFPLHLSVGQIIIEGEPKFTGILHDLSGRVRLEEQLREQATLAKLGEMAAVIAHEIKNPLAGIRGAMQVFASRITPEGVPPQILKEIISRIDALDQMMKDLLLFARPPKPRRVRTDVVALVEMTADLLSQDQSLHGLNIEVGGTAPPVSADPDMLRIVFQNLMINSAHAMQGKGKIRVMVDTVDTTCRIAFIDDGPGIPFEIREKIFAPFFTTKSRGSGLGLPTTKRLVEAHDGRVAIDCPPAGGTTVVVHLPLDTA